MKIAILTPSYSAQVNVHFAISLAATLSRVRQSECVFLTVVGSSILPMARNSLVAKAMAWGADKLVFIDDDVSWDTEDFQKLVLSEPKIMAGVYQKRPHAPHDAPDFAVSSFPDGMKPDFRGLVEVDGAATGFMRIDREVFEAMKPSACRLYDPKTHDGSEANELYEYFAYGKMIKDQRTAFEGEDYAFCRRARALGFKTFIDPAMKLGHHVGQYKFGASLPPLSLL